MQRIDFSSLYKKKNKFKTSNKSEKEEKKII